MISARSGVWLRSAGPGGCWRKTDGLPTLHILGFSLFFFWRGQRGGEDYESLASGEQVDAMCIGELHSKKNARSNQHFTSLQCRVPS